MCRITVVKGSIDEAGMKRTPPCVAIVGRVCYKDGQRIQEVVSNVNNFCKL